MKAVLDKLQEEKADEEIIKGFKEEAQNFVKFLVKKFDDLDLYMNDRAAEKPFSTMGIGVWVNESDEAPTFYYLTHGLEKVKF